MGITKKADLVILLATFNGEPFINEQLISLETQTFKDFDVIIRDDGSLDRTVDICRNFPTLRIRIIPSSKRLGPARNFLELLRLAEGYKIFMFADQDDIWLTDKVARAYEILIEQEEPHLYFSEAIQWWNDKKYATTNFGPPELPLNIFENFAMGCTLAINASARKLILQGAESSNHIIMHDWFALILVSIVGEVTYDPNPTLKYRIHGRQNIGPRKRFKIPNLAHVHNALRQFSDIYNFIYKNLPYHALKLSSTHRLRTTIIRHLYTKIVLKLYSRLKNPVVAEFDKFMELGPRT